MEAILDFIFASTLHMEECYGNGTKTGPLNPPCHPHWEEMPMGSLKTRLLARMWRGWKEWNKRQVVFNPQSFSDEKYGGLQVEASYECSWAATLCLRCHFYTSVPPTFPRTLVSNEFPSLYSPNANHELYSDLSVSQRSEKGKDNTDCKLRSPYELNA